MTTLFDWIDNVPNDYFWAAVVIALVVVSMVKVRNG